jgi:hypothetical protein
MLSLLLPAACAAAVRFGKYTPMRSKDKKVQIFVNGKPPVVAVVVVMLLSTHSSVVPGKTTGSDVSNACTGLYHTGTCSCLSSLPTATHIWPYRSP